MVGGEHLLGLHGFRDNVHKPQAIVLSAFCPTCSLRSSSRSVGIDFALVSDEEGGDKSGTMT